MNKRAAIYMRVSTREQSVDSQRADVERVAKANGYDVTVFEDKASGAKFSREGLDQMMRGVRTGKFEAVICYKLDRLGRSLPHLAQMIMEFDHHGVGLIVSSEGIDTTNTNPGARLQLNVLMAVAEFERSIISERTRAGLNAAKAKGVKLGRPMGSKGLSNTRKQKMRDELVKFPDATLKHLVRVCGVSIGTASNWRKEILFNKDHS